LRGNTWAKEPVLQKLFQIPNVALAQAMVEDVLSEGLYRSFVEAFDSFMCETRCSFCPFIYPSSFEKAA